MRFRHATSPRPYRPRAKAYPCCGRSNQTRSSKSDGFHSELSGRNEGGRNRRTHNRRRVRGRHEDGAIPNPPIIGHHEGRSCQGGVRIRPAAEGTGPISGATRGKSETRTAFADDPEAHRVFREHPVPADGRSL